MKVVCFERSEEGINTTNGLIEKCYFIPDIDVIFLQGYNYPGLYTDEERLIEARKIDAGLDPYKDDRTKSVCLPKFRDVQRFNYEDSKIKSLLEKLNQKTEIEIQIETEMKGLAQMAKSE